MRLKGRWTGPGRRERPRGLLFGAALGLTAALAAAGCSSASGSAADTGTAGTAAAGTASAAARAGEPAVTRAQARRVFEAYVAATAKAAKTSDQALARSVVTGVQQAALAAPHGRQTVFVAGGASSSAAYSSTLTITLGYVQQTYGTPTFYLPEGTGYPRFFAASARETVPGLPAGVHAAVVTGGTAVPADGTALLLFEQVRVGAPWLLASSSRLPAGVTLPKLAVDRAGYVPVVPSSSAGLLVRPAELGALQAAVVDDGPASAADRAVAAGPLTTGMYTGARSHVDGLRAPAGDVYQWELEGSTLPGFALGTADGGALTFYAMSLEETVAVPDEVNKAAPVRSGPPIPIPVSLLPLLPRGQAAPLTQLSSEQTLSFAAVDPPASAGQVQVIAIGGGLTSASAS